MKRKISLLVIIALFAACTVSFFACSKSGQLDTPTGLRFVGNSLTWKAVKNARGYMVNIDGYDNQTTQNTYSLADLTEEREYKIKVRAYADGIVFLNSEYSEIITFDYSQNYQRLATPVNLQIVGSNLTWDAVENASSYMVSIGSNGSNVERPASSNSYSLADLNAGSYTIKVMAISSVAEVADSRWSEAKPYDTTYSSKLVTPANLQINNNILSWDAVEGASGYTVNINDDEYPAETNTYSLEQLEPSTYLIKVMALSADPDIGNSSWSNGKQYNTISTGVMMYFAIKEGMEYEATANPEITGNTQPANTTSVSILSHYNGKPVTSIGEFSFYDFSALTLVEIPDTVTNIGSLAFGACTSLTSIALPQNLASIREGAFQLSGLKTITIPKNVSIIEPLVFSLCSSLASINVDEQSQYYSSVDGVLYNKDKTVFECYPQGRAGSTYKVLDGTRVINYTAFSNSKLTTITLPESLEEILQQAFFKSSITSLDIPAGVTVIEQEAFSHCVSLKGTVVIPGGVKSIGWYSFIDCPELENVIILEGVEIIEFGVFTSCTKLKSITIPSSVYGIGESVFYRCDSLTIYTEAAAKPEYWIELWNESDRPIIWGAELSADEGYVVSFVKSDISNTTATLSAPARVGYTFGGWSTTSGGTTANYTAQNVRDAINGTELYAIWNKI